MTGEGLLNCCQNRQNIIENTDVTLKNTEKVHHHCFRGHVTCRFHPLEGVFNCQQDEVQAPFQSVHITTELTIPYLPAKTFLV